MGIGLLNRKFPLKSLNFIKTKKLSRYFAELAYNGENYNGWQIQPNAPSVQETIEKALSTILRQPISVTGCGRTDTGVHAKYYVLHFDCEVENLDPDHLCHKLNRFLPQDIVFYSISLVDDQAHARFDARKRSYEYHVLLSKDPFLHSLATRLPSVPDFESMNNAAKELLRFTDFTSFSKLHTNVKTNNCDVSRAEWVKVNDHHWVFHISADRFLRNMVRAIVGTLLDVGRGKVSHEGFIEIIENKDRGQAGTSVPAHGLYLTKIKYPEAVFKATKRFT